MASKIDIVKFSNGKYGVRREDGVFWREYQFLDLDCGFVRWCNAGSGAQYQTEKYEDAVAACARFLDVGVPVNYNDPA
jgi:hypothetical protein